MDQSINDPPVPIPRASVRRLMFALGLACTALGIVGIILPVMPGTVFLLIAAWAFSRSSARLHAWLFHHPRFGRSIQNWHYHRVIPIRAKILAISMMSGSFAYVAITFSEHWIVPALVGAVVVPVAIWVATRASQIRAVPAQSPSR